MVIQMRIKPERLKWTPELVSRFWDGFSETELVHFTFSKQGGLSLLIAIDHLLPRDGEILDFGAGDGHLVKLLCDRGLRAAAYEPSEGRVEALKKRLARVEGFLGVVGKNTTGSFDLVIMAEVIEHLLDEEIDATLHRVADLTKPGGLLVITTPNDEDLELGMAYCPVSNLLFHRWQHVRSFSDETLVDLVCPYGFEAVVTHKVGFDPVVFLPHDRLAPASLDPAPLPDYIDKLRRNERVSIGSESNLLFLGRRT
jgi:2-polyprenyl-3-methyl-5-hydroxy-6-metoxy-1,4-benzoquinol methylase